MVIKNILEKSDSSNDNLIIDESRPTGFFRLEILWMIKFILVKLPPKTSYEETPTISYEPENITKSTQNSLESLEKSHGRSSKGRGP